MLRAGALVAKEKTDVQAMKDGVALRGQEMLRLKKKLADAEVFPLLCGLVLIVSNI